MIHNAAFTDHQPNIGRSNGPYRSNRRAVVGIAANINPVVVMIERLQRMIKHPTDHGRFIPRRDKDDNPARRHGFRQRARIGTAVKRINEDATPQGSDNPDHIDDQIINAADNKTDHGK